MSIRIDQLSLGWLQTNCYILGNPQTRQAILIDPADQADVILNKLAERDYTVALILATHTHFDHILASKAVKAATGAPFRLHQEGVAQLRGMAQLAGMFGIPVPEAAAEPDSFIEDGEIIEAAGFSLEARYTPGHSPGHLTFVLHANQVAFVGDCIFKFGVGAINLPGADVMQLKHSIEQNILTLPDDYTLLSGHGPRTTIAAVQAENPVLAELLAL